jgi:hypothetical protein
LIISHASFSVIDLFNILLTPSVIFSLTYLLINKPNWCFYIYSNLGHAQERWSSQKQDV